MPLRPVLEPAVGSHYPQRALSRMRRRSSCSTQAIAALTATVLGRGCRGADTPPPPPPLHTEDGGGGVFRTGGVVPQVRVETEWEETPVRVFFTPHSAQLTESGRQTLRDFYHDISRRTDIVEIRIEGHAIDQNTEDQNLRLSRQMAQAVIDFLSRTFSLSSDAFSIQPLGSEGDLSERNYVGISLLVRRL